MKKIFIIMFCLFIAGTASAQNRSTKGKEFWLCFMENLDLASNGAPRFSFFISSEVSTTGTISMPSNGFVQTFTVTGGQVKEVYLPVSIFYPTGSEIPSPKGIRIVTADPVSIGGQHHRTYFSESSIILPSGELGDEYFVLAHIDDPNLPNTGMSEFIVVATENATSIEITPAYMTKNTKPAGVPFTVTLNKGDVYQVQAYGDLSGSHIKTANGVKVAVFGGSNVSNVKCGSSSHLYDQLYPVSRFGREFVLMPFKPGFKDKFRILSAEDGTMIYLGCNTPFVLNKGNYMDTALGIPQTLFSNKPVSVGQFKYGQDCSFRGDCSFLADPPVTFTAKKAVFSTLTNSTGPVFDTYLVNVIAKTSDVSNVLLDGSPVTFNPVLSDTRFSYAHIDLSQLQGQHVLVSDSGFQAYASGFGLFDGYSHFLGYDQQKNSQRHHLTAVLPDTACIHTPLAFTANSTFPASSWFWNTGIATSTQQNPVFTFTTAGNYNIGITATDANGCAYVLDKSFFVSACSDTTEPVIPVVPGTEVCEVFVPTAFSPDNNSVNDHACVYGKCIKELDFRIYDRWGELVFQTNDQSKCWDGVYKGRTINNVVFAWTLKATLISGEEVLRKGNITSIK